MLTSRRGFIAGLSAALAAPAVVRAESLMKIANCRRSVFVLNSTIGDYGAEAVVLRGPISLAEIRSLLLPGLRAITEEYNFPSFRGVFSDASPG